MNRVITSEPTLTNGQPITKETIPFIENGVQEAISNLVKGLLGSYTTDDVIILEGVELSVTGGGNTLTWTDGSVYFNGEVYTVVAGNVTKTGGQTFVFTNAEGNGPVVTFEDNSNHYPHRIRQVQLVAGAAGGSGVDDYISDYNTSNVKSPFKKDHWHYIGTSGEPAFGAPFSNIGGGSDLKFRKDLQGNVAITGVVAYTGSGGATLFAIPVGYRPFEDFGGAMIDSVDAVGLTNHFPFRPSVSASTGIVSIVSLSGSAPPPSYIIIVDIKYNIN